MYILQEKFEELSCFTEVCRNFAPKMVQVLKGLIYINLKINA